ncbi:metal ABC transporter permease [Aureimonas frigidaquae]|uniref:metal ABC transporter permease n=1 Tax=Aureimonas frigidaquae TaxID=424757 RepID=UPI0007858881|nr:metal ABC transporter permease [Aureimonas frigidaquae]
MMEDFVFLSLAPLTIGLLAAVSCALVGNFLVLRRQALVGDAISHVVLPGIVMGFLVSGATHAWPMLLGAAVAAVLSVLLIEFIRRTGTVDGAAAMGTVFTAMFAAGVLLIERSDTSGVHLDVEHALYGSLESMIWFSGYGWGALLDPAALVDLPPQLSRLFIMLAVVIAFLIVFWRSLVISTFDPAYSVTIGAWPRLTGFLLVMITAAVAVTAFEAVGSIIVIAMFICPPAAARLMTDRMSGQILWSVAFAALSALGGFVLAAEAPLALGWGASVSAAGMIATLSGVILMVSALFGPRRLGVRG